MYFDSHVHSAASPDSKMNPEEAIVVLKDMGLGVAFTEHVDYSADTEGLDPSATDAPRGIGDFICDFSVYPSEYQKFRGDSVTLGLEIGLSAATFPLVSKLPLDEYDFIVGALHGVDGVDLYHAITGKLAHEPFAKQLANTDEVAGCIRRYLTCANELVTKFDRFDSFAHIDYIARYSSVTAGSFFYKNFPEEIDALLTTLARREIALEINTCLFRGFDAPGISRTTEKAMFEICHRFAALGGRICTIGSDAHKVDKLGHCIESAKEIAKVCGLTAVYFKERKPLPCEK